MAATATEVVDDGQLVFQAEPFSLLPAEGREGTLAEMQAQCGLSPDQHIEDAYPCSALQEGLMALAVKQPGSYIAKFAYRLPGHVNLAHFRTAWERTLALCGNLRTRIALVGGHSLQALVQNDISWEAMESDTLRPRSMQLTQLRCRTDRVCAGTEL